MQAKHGSLQLLFSCHHIAPSLGEKFKGKRKCIYTYVYKMKCNYFRQSQQERTSAVTLRVRWKWNHSVRTSVQSIITEPFLDSTPFQNTLTGLILPLLVIFNVELGSELCFQWGDSRKLHLTETRCGKGPVSVFSLCTASQISLSWKAQAQGKVRYMSSLSQLSWRCCYTEGVLHPIISIFSADTLRFSKSHISTVNMNHIQQPVSHPCLWEITFLLNSFETANMFWWKCDGTRLHFLLI